jgi:copper transport protein
VGRAPSQLPWSLVPTRTGVPGRTLRFLVAALAAVAGAQLLSGPVDAQIAGLVSSDPVDGADLPSPPAQITLTFDKPVGDSTVTLACNGDPWVEPNVGRANTSADQLTVTLAILTPMPAGECNVSWSAQQPNGDDGATGRFSFKVQTSPTQPQGSTPATTPGTGGTAVTTTTAAPATSGSSDGTNGSSDDVLDASTVSDGATWLGRTLSTLGVAVLFGSLVLIVVAWPEGPEYILAVRFLRSVWILAVIGTLLFVVALTAAVNRDSFGSGINPAGWLDLIDAGWPGRAALARLVLVVACVWVVWRPERVIDPTSQLPALAVPTLAVVTLGLTRTGGDLAALGVVMGIIHAVAMAVWVGGVVLLARVVLAGPGEEDLVQAVRGFGRISTTAIVATVVSGLVQLFRLDGASLFSDAHGRVLVLKTVVVAVMLFVGLTARQVAQSRLARAHDLSVPTADRLRRAFGTEAVIGVLVIGLSGWLLSFTPPKQPSGPSESYAVVEPFVDAASGIDMTVSLNPSRVGGNQLRVEVRKPAGDITGLTVTFVPPQGSNQGTIVQPIPLSKPGIAVSAPDHLPFRVPGTWTMQVSATTPQGSMSGATAPFDVRTSSGQLVTPGIGTSPSAPPVTPAPTTTAPPTTAPAAPPAT